MLGQFLRDLRFGFRILTKNPGFTAVAVLTLTLGIGAHTAIFSGFHAVLLHPLPFPEPDRLVVLSEKSAGGDRRVVAYPNYKDWRERAESFEDIAAFQPQSFNLTGVDRPVRLQGRNVTWNFFQILDVSPQLGRMFVEQDDAPGAAATVLVSNGFWKDQFGGDPDIVGRSIRIDGSQFTVVGVLPSDFEFARRDDIYVPLGLSLTPRSGLLDRGNHFALRALARLKPGVSEAQADLEMRSLAAQLEQEYPNTNSGNSAMVQGLSEFIVEDVRLGLIVLMAAVGFVLLIACVNVANLMLVRAAERHKEMAIRLALGASRGRVVRQLLSESLIIAVLGGVAGLVLSLWAVDALVALAPPDVPRLGKIRLNETVLVVTMVVSVITGLLFGLLPALQAAGENLQSALKEGGRSNRGALRERTRKLLLVAEVGFAFVLLIGAGLMLRTFSALMNVDPGFNTQNLLTLRFILTSDAYTEEKRRVFHDECVKRVEALPGVAAAALTISLPIDGSNWNSVFIAADKPVPERAQLLSSAFTPVSSNYFETLGVRLMRGRVFDESDTGNSQRVTVINETLARRLWPDEEPIGKRLKQGWPENQTPWREVIGVVADVKLNGVDVDTPLQAYLPLAQEPARSVALVARTRGNPVMLAPSIEQAVRSLDSELPVFGVRSMDQVLGNSVAERRLTMVLLTGLAAVALILAAVGIYGVMSYTVTQRRHEIGIRMAMGARKIDVLRLVVGQGLILTFIGIAIGLAAALGLTHVMSSLLFGVKATDPFTFGMLAFVLCAVAFLACYLPALRAMRIDPLEALRYE